MANDDAPDELDLAALLASVHGKSDLESRQEQLDAAVKAVETTHRQASLAIRQFERTGRTAAEVEVAQVIAALGALADDSAATQGPQVPNGPAGQQDPLDGPTQVTRGPSAASSGHEVTAIYVPPAAGQPVAPAAKDRPKPATAGSAAPLSEERTSTLASDPAAETTRIFPAAGATVQDSPSTAVASQRPEPAQAGDRIPPAEQRARVSHQGRDEPPAEPAQIVSGRGKDFGRAEVTRTKIIKRTRR